MAGTFSRGPLKGEGLSTEPTSDGFGVVPEQQFTVSQRYLQVLLFPGEGVRQVLDVLWLVFLHLRMERLQDFTDQGGDLLGDAARLLDFVKLRQKVGESTKEPSGLPFLLPHPFSAASKHGGFTFLVGILSFISSASRQRTFQGAWIFKKPTPWIFVYAPQEDNNYTVFEA